MVLAVPPAAGERWRCGHCGNLTRFDVARTRTVHEYWHFDLSGRPEIEQETPVDTSVHRVTCRWCGSSDSIEVVPRPAPGEEPTEGVGLGGTP
ncbi:MAG: hypothetical protein KDC39_01475 [Actinobacteria bacterium]|nr:hypothetical protein [Actinomycetota bacterium]